MPWPVRRDDLPTKMFEHLGDVGVGRGDGQAVGAAGVQHTRMRTQRGGNGWTGNASIASAKVASVSARASRCRMTPTWRTTRGMLSSVPENSNVGIAGFLLGRLRQFEITRRHFAVVDDQVRLQRLDLVRHVVSPGQAGDARMVGAVGQQRLRLVGQRPRPADHEIGGDRLEQDGGGRTGRQHMRDLIGNLHRAAGRIRSPPPPSAASGP